MLIMAQCEKENHFSFLAVNESEVCHISNCLLGDPSVHHHHGDKLLGPRCLK
jgi:hypothetical protein